MLGIAAQAGDQALDFFGRLPRTPGQGAHFVGHHGETTALLPGAGRLDGGIEGQQVGLVGDALDHFEDIADGVDLGAEAVDTGTRGLRRQRQLLDALQALAHHRLPGVDLVIRRLRRHGGLLGIARDVMHGRGHLLHGRGHLLGFFLLAAHLAIGLLGDRRQRLGTAGQLLDALLKPADDAG
ncbi:hypothetical protein D3C79_466250 [compost metagenome]